MPCMRESLCVCDWCVCLIGAMLETCSSGIFIESCIYTERLDRLFWATGYPGKKLQIWLFTCQETRQVHEIFIWIHVKWRNKSSDEWTHVINRHLHNIKTGLRGEKKILVLSNTLATTYQLWFSMSNSGTKEEMLSSTRTFFKGVMNGCACSNVCIPDRWKDETLWCNPRRPWLTCRERNRAEATRELGPKPWGLFIPSPFQPVFPSLLWSILGPNHRGQYGSPLFLSSPLSLLLLVVLQPLALPCYCQPVWITHRTLCGSVRNFLCYLYTFSQHFCADFLKGAWHRLERGR